MTEPNLEPDAVIEPPVHGWRGVAGQVWRDRMGRTGIITVVAVVLIAIIGPLLAPYDRGAVAGLTCRNPPGAQRSSLARHR